MIRVRMTIVKWSFFGNLNYFLIFEAVVDI